ncbi:hypothetical protein BH09SUM1_BH09SUM1_16460 [soil metagenome]
MTSKNRRRLIAFALVIVGIVAIVAVWARAALRSTGFDAEVAQIDARAKESGLEQKLIPKKSAPPAVVAAPSEVEPAPPPPARDFREAMRLLGRMRSNGAIFKAAVLDLNYVRRPSGDTAVMKMEGTVGAPGSATWSLGPEQMTTLMNRARRAISMAQSPGLLPAALEANAEKNRESVRLLNEALDDAEKVLLDPALDIPSFYTVPYATDAAAGTYVAEWCILRAVAKGDEEKAGALLDRWRQLYLLVWFASYPAQNVPQYSVEAHAWQFILRLAQIDGCPRSVFVRLADAFQQMQFTADEQEVMRQKHAIAIGRVVLQMVDSGVYRRDNTFRFFMNGAAQQYAQTAFRPVFNNQLEDFVMAWNARDAVRANAALDSLRRTEQLLNLKDDPIRQTFLNTWPHAPGDADYGGETEAAIRFRVEGDYTGMASEGGEMALFLTGCALHRSASGSWPASAGDLTDDEKALIGLDKLNLRFQVENVGAFHGPALADGLPPGASASAISSFMWREQRAPENMAEVAKAMKVPIANDENFDRFFIDIEPRPAFIGLRAMSEKDPRNSEMPGAAGVAVNVAWPDPIAPGFVVEWLFGGRE